MIVFNVFFLLYNEITKNVFFISGIIKYCGIIFLTAQISK
jgi:hypothetical protein